MTFAALKTEISSSNFKGVKCINFPLEYSFINQTSVEQQTSAIVRQDRIEKDTNFVFKEFAEWQKKWNILPKHKYLHGLRKGIVPLNQWKAGWGLGVGAKGLHSYDLGLPAEEGLGWRPAMQSEKWPTQSYRLKCGCFCEHFYFYNQNAQHLTVWVMFS